MTTAETLRKAADLIEERGHCQYRFGNPGGSMCTATALAVASGENSYSMLTSQKPPWREFERAAGNPCDFNNEHTKEEVVAKLREVADKTEVADRELVPA